MREKLMMTMNNLKLSNFVEDSNLFNFYFDSIYLTISQLENEYPLFKEWYYSKVKNEIINLSREVIFNITNDYIAGVSILKKTQFEKKICTLRVSNDFQKNGIGNSLLLDSFNYLETLKPLITVNSNRVNQFDKLFNYYGFENTNLYKNYYNNTSNEISFNGILK